MRLKLHGQHQTKPIIMIMLSCYYAALHYYTYVDAACCYRRSSVVCLSVCPVCHDREPCQNGRTDRDALSVVDSGGPKKPRIR